MTGGRYRLLDSRDFSLASAGGHHPPVGVDSVDKSGSDFFSIAQLKYRACAWKAYFFDD